MEASRMPPVPYMQKIGGMKVVFMEPAEACELLINSPFFTNGSPFLVCGPTDNVYIDVLGGVLNRVTTEIREAKYHVCMRGCILPYRGVGDRKLKGYFPHCFTRQHGLDQGVALPSPSRRIMGKRGRCKIMRPLAGVVKS
ncbi:hypothetical protein AMTR_s00141p00095530 [Amborella trichopoda]|uniref:Uncharacterized protein n=1 Tax=Amborella trichopoda TaxID=13333 RepID=W1PIS9_AMBTC|nr:hypothetical protein AMTR_s00141p00095530 [Amborella trichopoda]